MSDNLHDTRFLLKNLMGNIPDKIYFKDLESRFIMVNKAFCEWVGFDQDKVVGKTDFDLFAHEHAQQSYDDEQRIIATGEPLINVEERETWPDGRITWVSTTKMPLKSSASEIIGTFGVSRDITDQKELELKAAYYAEQVRRIKESMEEDLRMAAELQKTFFPRVYPAFPEGVNLSQSCVEFSHYYTASSMVIGDFCTVRRLSPTQSGILLCDVMGHGVRAALGTALICAISEEVCAIANDPGKFLERMNQILLPMLQQEEMLLFSTACYMVFDASTGLLRVANAGHPVPMYFNAEGKSAEWLIDDPSLRGIALAIDENSTYKTFEKKLQSGDSVVMYTDGLFEVERDDGEEFGEERLLAVAGRLTDLPLPHLFPALIHEACLFSGHDKLNDDVCLVGLHYKHPMADSIHVMK
jgi:sigma-B regulation protein RsbU (phosphoserine phosphatase)